MTCKRWGYSMTWEAQRRQYGRLARLGWSKDRIKQALPRCQTCVTYMLRNPEAPDTIGGTHER